MCEWVDCLSWKCRFVSTWSLFEAYLLTETLVKHHVGEIPLRGVPLMRFRTQNTENRHGSREPSPSSSVSSSRSLRARERIQGVVLFLALMNTGCFSVSGVGSFGGAGGGSLGSGAFGNPGFAAPGAPGAQAQGLAGIPGSSGLQQPVTGSFDPNGASGFLRGSGSGVPASMPGAQGGGIPAEGIVPSPFAPSTAQAPTTSQPTATSQPTVTSQQTATSQPTVTSQQTTTAQAPTSSTPAA